MGKLVEKFPWLSSLAYCLQAHGTAFQFPMHVQNIVPIRWIRSPSKKGCIGEEDPFPELIINPLGVTFISHSLNVKINKSKSNTFL